MKIIAASFITATFFFSPSNAAASESTPVIHQSSGLYYSNDGSESAPQSKPALSVELVKNTPNYQLQAKQVLKVKTGDCRSGVDQESGETLLICDMTRNQ